MTKNSDGLTEKINRMKSEKLYSLRINKQTVIFVTKDKCNEDYAEYYRKKCLEGDKEAIYANKLTPASDKLDVDIDILQRMYFSKRTMKQMADHFGVSQSTICNYVRQNNMVR